MITPRIPLHERLPEIYRHKDAELTPTGQLSAFVGILDDVLATLHARVGEQYHDLFIEHCADWLIPYFADLVGTSHLSGAPWTLRADIARTVKHRRRKGTIGAIESQVFALSRWAVHAVELRDRLAWNQHLNHQRPDAGGRPPLTLRRSIADPVRGGMATLRDPATLSFVDGPFDPFAHVVDVKPGGRLNLPNLGVFVWRLEDYQVPVSQPAPPRAAQIVLLGGAGIAAFAVRFAMHPLGEPMALFNTHRFEENAEPPDLTTEDTVPNPIARVRIDSRSPTGRPHEYVAIDTYNALPPTLPAQSVGLVLHVPAVPFQGRAWTIRGANLCAWESGIAPPLGPYEIAIDPRRGRVVFGVGDPVRANEATPLVNGLRVSATYGFSGPTGAHPIARPRLPVVWPDTQYDRLQVRYQDDPRALEVALGNLAMRTRPLVIEIADSMTHDVDLAAIAGHANDAGVRSLPLSAALWIRAASGERPVIRLRRPLRFRPSRIIGPNKVNVESLQVRLEGLYVTRQAAFGANEALITQAAVNAVELDGCTLDPGGSLVLDGTGPGSLAPIRDAMRLDERFGLAGAELGQFDQVPALLIRRSIVGPLAIDASYRLSVVDSIIDAGSGVADIAHRYALTAATGNRDEQWGPDLTVERMTVFGRMRVEACRGEGGIWVHRLEVHDNQDNHGLLRAPGDPRGCIRFSRFSGNNDRLPPHHGCVSGPDAALQFTSQTFGQPGYAQLASATDRRIREEGPDADEMGAFGYLLNTHKWKNINIRLRELMPAGVPVVLVPIT